MARDRGDRDDDRREDRDERKSGGSRFKYEERDEAAIRARANQTGGGYDSYITSKLPLFKPKEGDNVIRILPPTWPKPGHYGMDLWIHRNVGPDDQVYICPDKMGKKTEKCAICEARKSMDDDDAKSLKPIKRVALWLVDRDDEKAGPKIWAMPWTLDKEIAKLSVDKKTGESLKIDSPTKGFDVEFNREGSGKTTDYGAVAIARGASPMCEDEDRQGRWEDFIMDNPIPDQFVYFDYDYVRGVFSGAKEEKDEDLDEKPGDRRERRRERDEPKDEERSERGNNDRGSERRRERDEPEDDKKEDRGSRRDKEDEKPPERSRRREETTDDKDAPRERSRSRSEPEDDKKEDRGSDRRRGSDLDDEIPSKPRDGKAGRGEDDDAGKSDRTEVRGRLSERLGRRERE